MNKEHREHDSSEIEYCDECGKRFCWKCEEGRAELKEDEGIALCGDCSELIKSYDKLNKVKK